MHHFDILFFVIVGVIIVLNAPFRYSICFVIVGVIIVLNAPFRYSIFCYCEYCVE